MNKSDSPPKVVVPEPAAPKAEPSAPDRRWRIGGAVFLAVLAVVFAGPLTALARHAAASDLHSHILLVPFVSVYLLVARRELLPRTHRASPGWAAALGALGAAIYATAKWWPATAPPLSQNDFLALMAASFVCFLAAGGFAFLGSAWMSAAAFPVAFLIFIVPLPDRIVDLLETASKFASADAADMFFRLAGVPVFRDGLFFQLPGITIEVAQECSGIRSSWVLFITSLVASNFFLHSPWRRAILVGLVIPLAILRNGFRILVIGWLCVEMGPQMIHSAIHRRGGPVFFALSLIPLFILLVCLRRGDRRKV